MKVKIVADKHGLVPKVVLKAENEMEEAIFASMDSAVAQTERKWIIESSLVTTEESDTEQAETYLEFAWVETNEKQK